MEELKPGPRLVPKQEKPVVQHDEKKIEALKNLLKFYEDRISGEHPALTARILGPMGLDITKVNRDYKDQFSAVIIRYFLEHGSVENNTEKIIGRPDFRLTADESIAWSQAWDDVESQIKRIIS